MEKLLKQNRELLQAKRENMVKVNAIRKKLGQVQKSLEDTKFKLVEMESLQEKLDKLKRRAMGLEAEVDKLKTKVSKAKEVSNIEFTELGTYKLAFNTVVSQFLAKEIKMK